MSVSKYRESIKTLNTRLPTEEENLLIIQVISNNYLASLWLSSSVGSLVFKVFLALTISYLLRGK